MIPTERDLERWAEWLTLAATPQVGRRRLWQLVATLGSPAEVLRAHPEKLRSVDGVDEVTVRSIVEHRDALDMRDEARALAEMGARLITFQDDDYPRPLRTMDDPPPLLHVLGDLQPMDEAAVAIVGSRNVTDYGRQMAEAIAGDLAEAGVTVVSGFAQGVDGVAHRAALDRGGRTIAVLGCGLDIQYPAGHRLLRQRVVESGALITTHRLGASPRAENFPERNGVLSALGLGTVVVEASEKSGALITAHEAMAQGRMVFAVPGDVTRTNSRGVNLLIQEGARLVMSAADVLKDLHGALRGLMAEFGGQVTVGADGESPDPPPISLDVLEKLTDEEKKLFARIQAGPVHYDALAREVAKTAEARQTLPMHLMNLQMQGLIDELPGKRYTARPHAASIRLDDREEKLDSEESGL